MPNGLTDNSPATMSSKLVTAIPSVPITESRPVPTDLDSKLPHPGKLLMLLLVATMLGH